MLLYLDVFPLRFIVKNMSYISSEDLLSSGTRVDTNHSNSYRPWCITYRHLQVGVIGLSLRTE